MMSYTISTVVFPSSEVSSHLVGTGPQDFARGRSSTRRQGPGRKLGTSYRWPVSPINRWPSIDAMYSFYCKPSSYKRIQ